MGFGHQSEQGGRATWPGHGATNRHERAAERTYCQGDGRPGDCGKDQGEHAPEHRVPFAVAAGQAAVLGAVRDRERRVRPGRPGKRFALQAKATDLGNALGKQPTPAGRPARAPGGIHRGAGARRGRCPVRPDARVRQGCGDTGERGMKMAPILPGIAAEGIAGPAAAKGPAAWRWSGKARDLAALLQAGRMLSRDDPLFRPQNRQPSQPRAALLSRRADRGSADHRGAGCTGRQVIRSEAKQVFFPWPSEVGDGEGR